MECRDAEIACRLRNVGTSLYLDTDEMENVFQNAYCRDINALWTMKRQSNGYYIIESVFHDTFYLGIDDTDPNVDCLSLLGAIDNDAYWKIYVKSTGEMFIEPKTAAGKVLYAPSNTSGSALQLTYISKAVSNRNKWKIECVSDTPLEGQREDTWCWAATSSAPPVPSTW